MSKKSRNQHGKFYHQTPVEWLGLNKQTGEIGIEIEVEGANLVTQEALTYHWNRVPDGSLRTRVGGDCGEYVLRTPVPRTDVAKVLAYLNKKMRDTDAAPAFGYRTSVHVHLNAQQMRFLDIYKWLTLYYIVEEVLTEYAGESRQGNKFALRAVDAPNLVQRIARFAETDSWGADERSMRYAAANVTAIGKFGSVEFRAMRGTLEQDVLERWIGWLLAIKDKAQTYISPADIPAEFSQLGARDFLRSIDLSFANWVFDNVTGWEHKLFNGMRLAQDIAYATDWEQPSIKTEAPPAYDDTPAEQTRPITLAEAARQANRVFYNDMVEVATHSTNWEIMPDRTLTQQLDDYRRTVRVGTPRPAPTPNRGVRLRNVGTNTGRFTGRTVVR